MQMGSQSNVSGMVPVTKDDPLGALSQPDSGDFKTPTREKAVRLCFFSSNSLLFFFFISFHPKSCVVSKIAVPFSCFQLVWG